jgi:signal peptidase I
MKAGKATFMRALAAVVASRVFAIGVAAASLIGVAAVDPHNQALILVGVLGIVLFDIVGSWLIIRALMKCSLGGAVIGWLVGLLPAAGVLGLFHFVGVPFMLEFIVVPANSMAPTVVGWHYKGTCPRCGRTSFVAAPEPDARFPHFADREDHLGICVFCRQSDDVNNLANEETSPDRICVNKLLRPRRWDIVEFRYPPDPRIKYIKRLVGLPGETIFIEDGDVWINGARQAVPANLAGLKYASADGTPSPAGTRDDPWKLQEDEFFVLGDFSQRSSDSRYWGPVPRANIEGVAALIYWPANRWTIFR